MRIGVCKPKALVVDDDASIRMLVLRVLEREGFSVTAAADGFEAIEELKRAEFRLVLLDVMMPKIDGYGVLRFLRQSRPDLLASTVVMTAMLPQKFDSQVQVLDKPFDVGTLIRVAHEIVNDQRNQSIAT